MVLHNFASARQHFPPPPPYRRRPVHQPHKSRRLILRYEAKEKSSKTSKNCKASQKENPISPRGKEGWGREGRHWERSGRRGESEGTLDKKTNNPETVYRRAGSFAVTDLFLIQDILYRRAEGKREEGGGGVRGKAAAYVARGKKNERPASRRLHSTLPLSA